jgi:hypothetical protein
MTIHNKNSYGDCFGLFVTNESTTQTVAYWNSSFLPMGASEMMTRSDRMMRDLDPHHSTHGTTFVVGIMKLPLLDVANIPTPEGGGYGLIVGNDLYTLDTWDDSLKTESTHTRVCVLERWKRAIRTTSDTTNAWNVLLTCPHGMRSGECGEMNDPMAQEVAVKVYKDLLPHTQINLSLWVGSTDRRRCDLNRTSCSSPPFHDAFANNVAWCDIHFDIHSYPSGKSFGQATGVVCLLPIADASGHSRTMSNILLASYRNKLAVMQGGDNRLINTTAGQKHKAGLLLEFPYVRTGACKWAMPDVDAHIAPLVSAIVHTCKQHLTESQNCFDDDQHFVVFDP